MEAGRSWPDLSSLERVLIPDYWLRSPQQHKQPLSQRKAYFFHTESANTKVSVADQTLCHSTDKCDET